MSIKLLKYCTLAALLLVANWSIAQDKAKPAAEENAIEVKLLEAGKGPLKPIRIQPKKGDKQTAVMSMSVSQTMVVRGQKIPVPATPTMQFTIDVAVKDVAANGDVTFDFVYREAELVKGENAQEAVLAAMEPMITSMKGLKGSATVSNRGYAKESDIKVPEGINPEVGTMIESMKDSMGRISSPLPEEPVGVGAKWTVKQDAVSNGMKITQTTTHTLKGIKDGKYDIALEVEQKGDEQEIKAPGLPPGAKLTLKSLESTGTGTMLLDAGAILPQSDMTLESKNSMQVDVGGQAQPMDAEVKMTMKLGPEGQETKK